MDTSVLAAVASRFASLKAFTVALQGAQAPDVKYAALVADRLGLEHFVHYFDYEELYDSVHAVIKIMGSFDPMEIRNSAAIYIGLKFAKEKGISSIMTGDGGDELFVGYSFLLALEEGRLKSELQKLWSVMSFSSIPLGKSLGIEVKLPYLDQTIKSFAMKLDLGYKVRRENETKWGKWILRKAFEGILPKEIVWREKAPIEQGSGTAMLPSILENEISNEEFEEKKSSYLIRDKVNVRSKEQLFYYEIYKSIFGAPHPIYPEGKLCPYCNSNVDERSAYCRTCGAYPI